MERIDVDKSGELDYNEFIRLFDSYGLKTDDIPGDLKEPQIGMSRTGTFKMQQTMAQFSPTEKGLLSDAINKVAAKFKGSLRVQDVFQIYDTEARGALDKTQFKSFV